MKTGELGKGDLSLTFAGAVAAPDLALVYDAFPVGFYLLCLYPGDPLRPRSCLLAHCCGFFGCLAKAMATCRRKMIAEALGEQGGKGLCDGGCDVCSGCAGAATNVDATRHATTLVRFASVPQFLHSSIVYTNMDLSIIYE